MALENTREVPDSWSLKRLDEVSDIIDSLHQTPQYTDNGVPMVRVTDVKGGYLDLSETKCVTEEVFNEFTRRYVPRRGDIVFSRVGTYGNVSYISTDSKFCLGQNTAIISPKINSLFVYYCLKSPSVQRQIENSAVGSTQKTISLKSISALRVPVPPKLELEAIGNILGALDDKIMLNRQMTDTLEETIRTLFKSWFVDFDPVHAKIDSRDTSLNKDLFYLFPKRFVDSDLGEVPEGWSIGKFGDIADNPRRGVQPYSIDRETPYIALEHMPKGRIALDDLGIANGVVSNKFAFYKYEILFGKLRPYFHKVGVAPMDGVCSTDILVITPKNKNWFGFALGHASSDSFVDYATAGSNGTKMPRTSWNELSGYKVVIPPEEIAKAFSTQIEPLINRIIASTQQSSTLAELRDMILPKLMSGEIRISKKVRVAAGV